MNTERQIVTPYLCCRDAARALAFYERAFVGSNRYLTPDGAVGHADLEVAGGRFMLSDEWPDENVYSPAKYGGSPIAIQLVVPDVDSLAARAVAAGATLERAAADQPHGDRSCTVPKEGLRRRAGGRFEVD